MKDIGRELALVGAGISGGFCTLLSCIMKYDEAMALKDIKHWEKGLEEEQSENA